MVIKSILNKENTFKILLTVHSLCNYSCKYCPDNLHDGKYTDITADQYLNFFKNLMIDNPEILDYKNKKITFTGGEPTLFPDIEKLLFFFKENKFKNVNNIIETKNIIIIVNILFSSRN